MSTLPRCSLVLPMLQSSGGRRRPAPYLPAPRAPETQRLMAPPTTDGGGRKVARCCASVVGRRGNRAHEARGGDLVAFRGAVEGMGLERTTSTLRRQIGRILVNTTGA